MDDCSEFWKLHLKVNLFRVEAGEKEACNQACTELNNK